MGCLLAANSDFYYIFIISYSICLFAKEKALKKSIFFIIALSFINNLFAETLFTVEIHSVVVNGGAIFLGFYSSDQSFRNESPNITFQMDPTSDIIIKEITLPEGEYVIGIHQDTNGNGIMDYRLFGIPREPYGFSNMRGRIPSNFDQMKIYVNNLSNRKIIPLVRF